MYCQYLHVNSKRLNNRPLIKHDSGYILILTLMIVGLLTAMTVVFMYDVFVGTNALYNYRDGMRLSVEAESGVFLAVDFIGDYLSGVKYTDLDKYLLDSRGYTGITDDSANSEDIMTITISDEQAKFNINTIVYENGLPNRSAIFSLQALLKELTLNEEIAYYIADWIDPDDISRFRDSEGYVKNDYLYTLDELMYIKGIDSEIFKSLSSYVTVYGDGMININTAPMPVLASISYENDSKEMTTLGSERSEKILAYREYTPFNASYDIIKVADMEGVGAKLIGNITVKSSCFNIVSTTSFRELKRVISSTVLLESGESRILYWKEL